MDSLAGRVLVTVDSLRVAFKVSARDWLGRSQILHAVDGVSLELAAGETLSLVGESGCGKTTLGRVLVGIYKPTGGKVTYRGTDITTMRGEELRHWRRNVQLIFQDPYASLNPRMKVVDIVGEPLWAQRVGNRDERRARVREVLELVGLPPDAANRYPNAFSGGQRQRIGIARALAIRPEFLVADEAVSALDVSIQAQIVNLITDLQKRLDITMLFIAHDLAVVRHISSRVAVMYAGQIVEIGPTKRIFAESLHPYTQALLAAVPIPDPPFQRSRTRILLQGEVPSAISPPSGCRFHTRCPFAMPHCRTIEPQLREVSAGYKVACHLVHPPSTTDSTSALMHPTQATLVP